MNSGKYQTKTIFFQWEQVQLIKYEGGKSIKQEDLEFLEKGWKGMKGR